MTTATSAHGRADPLVSVILPTYNRARLVGRAVQSVLAQTYTNFELIVVDDGSSDNTAEIVAGFSDPRLIYHRRAENGRAAAARNDGIARARGEFVAFQDDDDVWMPHKLEMQVRALSEAPPDVGLCLAAHVRWVRGDAWYIGGPKYFSLLDFSGGVYYGIDYSLIATPAWLVRRSALDRAGGFDVRMRTWDDLELAIRLSEVCKFIHVEEPLYVQDHVLGSGMMNNQSLAANDLELMLEKHGHRWEHDRALMAKQYYLLGRLESIYGDCTRADRWFRRGMRYRPIFPKLWLGWAMARLGPKFVHGVTHFMRTRVRPSWIGPFLYRE